MRWLGVLPIVLAGVFLPPPQPVAAHPLDACLHAAYLTPAARAITLQLDISPGVLVAPAALADLDRDTDRQISDPESHAYAERVLGQVRLSVDGQVLPATLTRVEMPPHLTVRAGYGVIRLHARFDGAPATGAHEIHFRNDHTPRGATYQVNGIVDGPVVLTHQQRAEAQRETRIGYRIDAAATGSAPSAAEPRSSGLAGLLESPALSPWVVLLALASAALLGALHALTPGHAKALTAAYLIGSGGTARTALGLGAVVTLTHTASVIAIGLVALLASRYLVPGVLAPALEIVSGILVLVIGLHLLSRRHRGAVPHTHEHHEHPHPHPHPHPPAGRRGVLAMGVSGGLVPCPEALGVMVLAVGVNRTVFGLGLLLSFSLGLAAVLMTIGVALVRSHHLLDRFGRLGARTATILPLVSAVVVTLLGAGLLIRGVASGLPLLS